MSRSVAVLMGSESDWESMAEAVAALEELGVGCEVEVMSAHRTPDVVVRFVHESESRGVALFICGAGLAAHLAGVVAAHTTRPVLGVPLAAAGPGLGGLDALLSTVQMPPGVPVASFAIGKPGARNAGIFAAQVLALSDEKLAQRLVDLKARMHAKVTAASAALKERRRGASPAGSGR